MKIILVYFDVDRGPKGLARNKIIRENIEEKIANNERKGLIILGDFNGHLNLLEEDRKTDKNGTMVLEWMEEFNLKLINATEMCRGEIYKNSGRSEECFGLHSIKQDCIRHMYQNGHR